MPFVPAQCISLTEVTILQYFKSLHDNEFINFTDALQFPVELNKQSAKAKADLDEANLLVLDYYEKFIDLLNVSLASKRQMFISSIHEADKNEQLIKKTLAQFIQAYYNLKTQAPDIIEYLFNSSKKFSPNRSCLYYLIVTNINHNAQWQLNEILVEWINALKLTTKDEMEVHLLDFFEFILGKNSDIGVVIANNPFTDFYTDTLHPYELYHAYLKSKKHKSTVELLSKFSGQKEDFPQFFAQLLSSPLGNFILEPKSGTEVITPFEHHKSLQLFNKFPTFNPSVPNFVISFTKTYLTGHLLTSSFFDSQSKQFYLELIEILTKNDFLSKTNESIDELKTLSNLAVFVDKLIFSSVNYMLIPSENLHFIQVRKYLIHRQTALFNWLCIKRVSPNLIRLLVQGLDTLLAKSENYRQYQYPSREFWFSVSRILITDNTEDPIFIDILGKHIYTVLDNLLLNDLEIIANGLLGKFISYGPFLQLVRANTFKKMSFVVDNPFKKYFSHFKVKQLQELAQCMEFLSMLPRIDEDPQKYENRFCKICEFLQLEQPKLKYLNFYFLNYQFKSLPILLKTTLLSRVPLLTPHIKQSKNHEAINLLAQMIFKMALILQVDEEKRASLEQIFDFSKTKEALRAFELELGYDRQEPEALLFVNPEEEDTFFELCARPESDDSDEKSMAAAAPACSFFKKAPKNLIAKHLLPTPLLQLSALINQVFHKELVLRGGAVMDLLTYGSIEKINDYDPIVFNLELEKINLALQQHCFALGHLSVEELSELQSRTNINKHLKFANKHNYKLKVFSLEQALEINKACLKLPQIAEKIICAPTFQASIIGQGSRRALMIAHQGIHIDLVNFSSSSKKFSAQIKEYHQSGDFEISSLHMVLDLSLEHFIIDGAPQALLAAHQQCISIVNDKTDIFSEDPIRIFRLVKEMLKKPDFSLDFKLLRLVKQTDFNLLFKQCFQDNLALYRGRISIAFSKLYDHFSIPEVLASLYKLGVFENIFNLDYQTVSEHFGVFENLEHLTAYQKKLVFFELIYAHLCHQYPEDATREALPITQVVKQVSPEDKIKMQYIETCLLGKDYAVFVNDDKLNEILIMFPHIKASSSLSL